MFFRMGFAAIALSAVSFSLGKVTRIEKKDWGWLLLLVLLEPFIYFIGESLGLRMLNSPTISSVIISTIPIITMIAGVLVFKEKISLLNRVGILMTLPGIILMVYEKGSFDVSKKMGLFYLFVAVFAAVGYAMVAKKLADKYNSYTIVTYQHILGTLYFLPLFLIYVGPTFSFSMLTMEVIKPLLYLSLFCSSLAFILFINAIRELGVARTNIFSAVVPAISAYAAYLMGQEIMNLQKIVGIAIVITGVILAQRRKEEPLEAASTKES